MSSSTLVYEKTQSQAARIADFVELTKPKIAVMELVVVAASAMIASDVSPAAATVAWLLVDLATIVGHRGTPSSAK